MRPCDRCGEPIGNGERCCASCLDKTPPAVDQPVDSAALVSTPTQPADDPAPLTLKLALFLIFVLLRTVLIILAVAASGWFVIGLAVYDAVLIGLVISAIITAAEAVVG